MNEALIMGMCCVHFYDATRYSATFEFELLETKLSFFVQTRKTFGAREIEISRITRYGTVESPGKVASRLRIFYDLYYDGYKKPVSELSDTDFQAMETLYEQLASGIEKALGGFESGLLNATIEPQRDQISDYNNWVRILDDIKKVH
jgi:hypothetical protein